MKRSRAIVVESSDESSDDASSSSQSSNALIDNEAVNVDASDDDRSSTVDREPLESFPQFMKFPAELRRYFWDIFCPDIADKHPRVLQLSIISRPMDPSPESGSAWGFEPSLATEDQTEGARIMGAIHHETRSIVTKAFPDTITLWQNVGVIRFDADRDIILQDSCTQDVLRWTTQPPEPGTCDRIKHMCFTLRDQPMEFVNPEMGVAQDHISYLRHMPNLETIMMAFSPEPGDGQYRFKGWLAEEGVVESHIYTYRKSEGLGEDLEWACLWPDWKRYPHLAQEVSKPYLEPDVLGEEMQQFALEKHAKFVPMLLFDFNNLDYLEKLRVEYTNEHPWEPDGSTYSVEYSAGEDEDESVGEYESDGINDDTIEQWDDHDEDELIPPPLSPPHGYGRSPISVRSDSDSDDDEVAGEDAQSPQAGNFSSPEPETDDREESVARRPKRRIVSDSEDEEDDEPAAKRVKRPAVLISSDDEDENQEVRHRSRGGSRAAPQVISDNDDASSSSEESSSEEDDAPPKPVSLAQRLRVGPNQQPENESDGHDDSDDADSFCSYADGEDDEEEDDSEGGDGLVEHMASDTDDDHGDGADDSGW